MHVPPRRHVAGRPAGGFAPTRNASPGRIPRVGLASGSARSRRPKVWAACRSLPCGGSVVVTNEPAKCRRSLTAEQVVVDDRKGGNCEVALTY